MGTSESYKGPGSRNPLLPPWADDPLQALPNSSDEQGDGEVDQDEQQNGNGIGNEDRGNSINQDADVERILRPLQPLKTSRFYITRYVNSGNSGYLRKGIREHIKSLGGAGGATSAARSGRSATQKLGGFLSTTSSKGISSASEDLGISGILGMSLDEALNKIIDCLVPEFALLEEVLARRAIVKTFEELYYQYGLDEHGLEALDNIDQEGVQDAIVSSATNYVYERVLLELADRIEKKTN